MEITLRPSCGRCGAPTAKLVGRKSDDVLDIHGVWYCASCFMELRREGRAEQERRTRMRIEAIEGLRFNGVKQL